MKKTVLVTSFFVLIVLAVPAQAAPAPSGIAINEDEENCTGYWSGD